MKPFFSIIKVPKIQNVQYIELITMAFAFTVSIFMVDSLQHHDMMFQSFKIQEWYNRNFHNKTTNSMNHHATKILASDQF